MSSNEENDEIINQICYDEAGYGSVLTTCKDARLKDPKITMKFVQGWCAGSVITRKQPGAEIALLPHPFYEFQLDLFWLSDLEGQKFTVGCLYRYI